MATQKGIEKAWLLKIRETLQFAVNLADEDTASLMLDIVDFINSQLAVSHLPEVLITPEDFDALTDAYLYCIKYVPPLPGVQIKTNIRKMRHIYESADEAEIVIPEVQSRIERIMAGKYPKRPRPNTHFR